jgi:predicted site-specific integrase-resolvase
MSSPPAKTTVRCAIYTRKSSDEGLDQEFNSLDAQYDACSAYIASQKHEGWKQLPDRFDDGGISGGTLERPALQRLMAEIDAGRIDMVVVYKIDRLTRALADFVRLVERLDAKGCSFVSVTQAFNTSTSMGRLTLNVLLSFAQFEREVMGETKEGQAARLADLQAHALTEPLAPLRPERLASDMTIEGLVKYFLEGQPSMGLFNDEGGIFLGGFGMSAESRMRTVSGFSALWDGSAVTRTRSGDGTATISHRRFACHLMVQPVLAAPLLADPLAAQQGFLPRFLMVSPASQIGRRIGHEPSPLSMDTVTTFATRITDLLELVALPELSIVSGKQRREAYRVVRG